MDENPYKAPKEDQRLTARTGAAVAVWGVLAIPAGCICGGATCYSVALTGSMLTEDPSVFAMIGIPLGIIVAIAVATYLIQLSPKSSKRQSPGGDIDESTR